MKKHILIALVVLLLCSANGHIKAMGTKRTFHEVGGSAAGDAYKSMMEASKRRVIEPDNDDDDDDIAIIQPTKPSHSGLECTIGESDERISISPKTISYFAMFAGMTMHTEEFLGLRLEEASGKCVLHDLNGSILQSVLDDSDVVGNVREQQRDDESEREAAKRFISGLPAMPFEENRFTLMMNKLIYADYLGQPSLEEYYARQMASMMLTRESLSYLSRRDANYMALIKKLRPHFKARIEQYMSLLIQSLPKEEFLIATHAESRDPINSVAISANGNTVVTAAQAVRILEMGLDGRKFRETSYSHHPRIHNWKHILKVAVSADGDIVASQSQGEGCVILEKEGEWRLTHSLRGHSDIIGTLDDGTIVMRSALGGIRGLRRNGDQNRLDSDTSAYFKSYRLLSVAANGERAVAKNIDDSVICEKNTEGYWREAYRLEGCSARIAAMSADGQMTVITDDEEGYVFKRDASGRWEQVYSFNRPHYVSEIVMASNGKAFVVRNRDYARIIWYEEKEAHDSVGNSDDDTDANEDDGAGIGEGNVGNRDINEDDNGDGSDDDDGGEEWNEYVIRHEGPIASIAISANGKRVVAGFRNAIARVMEKGRQGLWETIHTIQHEGAVTAVAISAHGDRVVTGSADTTAKMTILDRRTTTIDDLCKIYA